MVRTHRASHLPRILACPASMMETEHPVAYESEAREEGVRLHAETATLLRGGESDEPLAHRAVEWLQRIVDTGDENVRGRMHIERQMEAKGRMLSGSPDLWIEPVDLDGQVILVDWKYGYVPRDYGAQLSAYAYMIADETGCEDCRAYAYYPRLGIAQEHYIGPIELTQLAQDISSAENSRRKEHAPGEACTYCPRQHECQARRDMLRTCAEAFIAYRGQPLADSDMADMHRQAKRLRQALAIFDKALKSALERTPLRAGESELYLDNTPAESIDTAQLRTAATDWLTAAEIDEASTVSKTALVKAVRAKAAKGAKLAAEKEFMESLRTAGAVRRSYRQTVKER